MDVSQVVFPIRQIYIENFKRSTGCLCSSSCLLGFILAVHNKNTVPKTDVPNLGSTVDPNRLRLNSEYEGLHLGISIPKLMGAPVRQKLKSWKAPNGKKTLKT